MNREIKFRAWEIDWKNNSKKQGRMLQWEDIRDDFAQIQDKTSYFILMQYTGLKDKNGTEIYEGDLFGEMGGDKERPGEYEVFGEVYFDIDFAGFCVKYPNGGWSTLGEHLLRVRNHREVIGNIYENPSLLK